MRAHGARRRSGQTCRRPVPRAFLGSPAGGRCPSCFADDISAREFPWLTGALVLVPVELARRPCSASAMGSGTGFARASPPRRGVDVPSSITRTMTIFLKALTFRPSLIGFSITPSAKALRKGVLPTGRRPPRSGCFGSVMISASLNSGGRRSKSMPHSSQRRRRRSLSSLGERRPCRYLLGQCRPQKIRMTIHNL